jgi:mono/diheme cytochrome c family protein
VNERNARLAALVMALGLAGCSAEGDRPGMAFLPDMVDSGVVRAYDRNPMRPSVPSLFVPPDGTVPVEWSPFPYGPGPEEARRAGTELRSPVAAAPDVLARGKQVYDTICTVCHGPKGEGDGPIIGRFPNPPSLLAAHAKALPDGQIVHIVTRGQGIMPSHAAQVLLPDRWKVALYVRQLQGVEAREATTVAVAASTTEVTR